MIKVKNLMVEGMLRLGYFDFDGLRPVDGVYRNGKTVSRASRFDRYGSRATFGQIDFFFPIKEMQEMSFIDLKLHLTLEFLLETEA